MKTPITPEIMTKVWKLHTNAVDAQLIGETLGISLTSVNRVIQIMTAAKNGEDVDSIGGDNHRRQKAFAKEYFGIEEKKEEEPTEESLKIENEKPTFDDGNFKEFAINVLFELSHISRLLERLCDELGVNDSAKS